MIVVNRFFTDTRLKLISAEESVRWKISIETGWEMKYPTRIPKPTWQPTCESESFPRASFWIVMPLTGTEVARFVPHFRPRQSESSFASLTAVPLRSFAQKWNSTGFALRYMQQGKLLHIGYFSPAHPLPAIREAPIAAKPRTGMNNACYGVARSHPESTGWEQSSFRCGNRRFFARSRKSRICAETYAGTSHEETRRLT